MSGYTVLAARDATEALRVSEAHSSPIHVLMTDIVMPGMSGPELAHRFLQDHPAARVLFVSGYSDDAIAHHGLLETNAAFLEKPFSHRVLAERVRALLDKTTTEALR